MRNSFKQLFRKPAKPLLFFFLMAAATMLLIFGGAMYYQNVLRTQALEDLFTTVATVEQPISAAPDANNDVIFPEVLDFEGADYIIPPQVRPLYVADLTGSVRAEMGAESQDEETIPPYDLLEFKVTGIPDDPEAPITATITQAFVNGTARRDHEPDGDYYNEDIRTKPGMDIEIARYKAAEDLEVGKTYVGYMYDNYMHEWWWQDQYMTRDPEPFFLTDSPTTALLDADGQPMEGRIPNTNSGAFPLYFEEVTPGFYDEGGGFEAWQNMLDASTAKSNLIPIAAVSNWDLVQCARNNTIRLRNSSRMITQEELDSGAKVCMVSKEYATRHLIFEGDKIEIPLLATLYNYHYNDGYGNWYFYMPSGASLLDPDGKFYEPFSTEEYEVVGIFSLQYSSDELPYQNMLIIPQNAAGSVEDQHILYYGPMNKASTSFMIPNGAAEKFTAAFEANVPEADRLNLAFDDMGYSRAIDSINESKQTAFLLFAVGLLAATAIVALLMYFFVVLEKKRTAIERSLGMTRRQCRVSLMAGLLALTLVATFAGSAGAGVLLEKVDEASLARIEEQNKAAGEDGSVVVDWGLGGIYNFSAQYSPWAMWDVKGNQAALEAITPPLALYLLAPFILCIFVGILAASLINHNLKIEPILLLNAK